MRQVLACGLRFRDSLRRGKAKKAGVLLKRLHTRPTAPHCHQATAVD